MSTPRSTKLSRGSRNSGRRRLGKSTAQGKNKYQAKKVEIDGHRFDSKREAHRYQELKLLEKAGEISSLEVHPRIEILPAFAMANGEKVRRMDYIPDFRYRRDGQVIIEDVKGVATEGWRLKWKLLKYRCRGDPHVELRVVR
jgi:hypothetical protein